MKNKTIILTGGGTAGHIMPNIALLSELKKHFSRICYVGTNGMEKDIAKQHGLEFFEISAIKLIRKLTLKNCLIPFKLIKSINQCKKIIKEIKPDVIFSKGGYVSVPLAIAGKKYNIPVISHESDLSIGLANKIIAKYAVAVCTSFFETSQKNKKFVYTGSPIREQIFKGNKNLVMQKYNLDKQKPTILFLGGSLGSKAINNCVVDNLSALCKKFNILHIAGKTMTPEAKNNYVRFDFVSDIENLYACSDVVVCRSGANTIFELLALTKPMILIPLPKTESRGDQIENAENFEKNKYAEIIYQENLNINTLINKIENCLKNKEKIIFNQQKANLKNANKNIIKIILKYSK